MNRRRAARPRVVGGVVAVALVAAAGAWWWVTSVHQDPAQPESDRTDARYFSGYFSQGEQLVLEYRSIPDGQYALAYRFDARVSAPDGTVALVCGFIDANGTIGYLGNSERVFIPATGETRSVAFSGSFQLPEITIALTCAPSASGQLSVQFSNLSLSVVTVE